MSDLISRQAALMEARPEYLNPSQQGRESYNQGWNDAIGEYYTGIKALPSADRPTGEWIQNDNGTWLCNQCHSWIPDEQHYYARYCLYCGAKMGGDIE